MVRNLSAISGRPGSLDSSLALANNTNGSSCGSRCERRSRRKRTKKGVAQEIAADWSKGNKEARRCDSQLLVYYPTEQVAAETGPEAQTNSEVDLDHSTNSVATQSPTVEFQQRLEHLLVNEILYHPKTESLMRICAPGEDKVDARLRDEAVFNLRFLHKFYNLSPECFANAVNIADRFIVKIKVKPKYMACLATAAYLIACKMVEDPMDWPTPEKLVSIARCGGSANDLERMEGIIRAKLGDQTLPDMQKAVTPLHFLRLLEPLFPNAKSFQRAVGDLEICLCSVAVYAFRPSQLALGVARRYLEGSQGTQPALLSMAKMMELTECDLAVCEAALESESRRVQSRTPAPRTLVWNLSRRTISCLQKPSAAAQASLLDPIREDRFEDLEMEEDGSWEIARLFD